MEKCWAYYPIAGTRSAWIPCVRKAEEGSHFCRRHGDAIAGALLGAVVHAAPMEEALILPDEPLPAWMARESSRPRCERIAKQKKAGSQPKAIKQKAILESPANDPFAGNLRVAGGSERGRGVPAPECAR